MTTYIAIAISIAVALVVIETSSNDAERHGKDYNRRKFHGCFFPCCFGRGVIAILLLERFYEGLGVS